MMDLKKMISQGESEKLEFKKSAADWKAIIKTVAAFSNSRGGKIIIGVVDSLKSAGIKIGKDTVENLTNQISQNTDPKVHPHITIKEINSESVIIIEVKESPDHLVLAFGRPFKRTGKSTVKMSKDEYENLILEKHKEKLQFGRQIFQRATLKDIDWEFVKEKFIPLCEKISGQKIVGKPQSLLESLGCIKNRKITNAGLLLFGKAPQNFFMNSYIALARYKDREVDVERIDYKEFNGNLFKQIDDCDRYIKEHISVMSRLHPYQVQREDIPEYGLFSIRELITNALCHRDYKNQHTKVIMKIFDGKIEFYNPGGLPQDITPQNITEKQFSRNPVIAKILEKVQYIEELGEGWDKIIREHRNHPLKPRLPQIKSDKYTTTVTLFSVKDKFETKKVGIELNGRQKYAIEKVKSQGFVRSIEMQKKFNVTRDTANRDLNFLIKLNLIKREGIGKKVRYIQK